MTAPAVLAHHLGRLRSPAWRPRAQAARMLAADADLPEVAQALAAVARGDSNLAVRIQALRAVARSGRPEARGLLEEVLAGGPEPLQEHALSGLAEWGVASGREEEAARRLLDATQCGDDPDALRRRGIALYALGELDVAGVGEALDRFFEADDWPTAGGAWSSAAYRKQRRRLPDILRWVESAPDEWVHDQALKTARLLADVQGSYYQLSFSVEPEWVQGLDGAFPDGARNQARPALERVARAWRAGDYPEALGTMGWLASLLLVELGRAHGLPGWEGGAGDGDPARWLREVDELSWARLSLILYLAERPRFFDGRIRRWAEEELRTAAACFLETFPRVVRLDRAWSGRDPAEGATEEGRKVWQLDADQERAPYALLVRLKRLGKEALPALRAFLEDSLVLHGHAWALEVLGEVGEAQDLDRLLALTTYPPLAEAAQAATARFGPAALVRVSPWLRRADEGARIAAAGVVSRIPLPESWLALGELLPGSEGPLFQAAVRGLVRLGGPASLEALAAAGRSLDGERALLARQAAVYLAGWEEDHGEILREWRDVPLLGPLPDPAVVGVHEFDVYTGPDHEDPPDPDDRLPDPLPVLEPEGS
ncbi:HEAT repeat domain-containing protein [Limnochorda pilosa]|uniref:Uncharacterized protein n=1 Tax=Limnochorda pilosa TaxID=1555112 RepID=A0A0K2SNX4_LIMPI|nr:HEAT repeat domain-containing protein [Limnochorda pilosa]BAS28838.1 hypothetical protein LIP_3009 [Limnochorda pilosa]